MIQLTCSQCSKPFSAVNRKTRRQRFCSQACAGDAKRQPIVYPVCRWCRRTFRPRRTRPSHIRKRIYCSLFCWSHAVNTELIPQQYKRRRIEVDCSWCGRPKEAKHSEFLRYTRFFCGRKCKGAYFGRTKTLRAKRHQGSWTVNRRLVLDRDAHRCRICKTSERLLVHHLRPIREWLITEAGHALSNLVTLCAPCHYDVHWRNQIIPR